MVTEDTLRFLESIAAAYAEMENLAARLRQYPGVKEVLQSTSMPVLPQAFRLERYVDAELETGEAVSWGIEFTVTSDQCDLEADVRRMHLHGQDLFRHVANETHRDLRSASEAIVRAVKQLCQVLPANAHE